MREKNTPYVSAMACIFPAFRTPNHCFHLSHALIYAMHKFQPSLWQTDLLSGGPLPLLFRDKQTPQVSLFKIKTPLLSTSNVTSMINCPEGLLEGPRNQGSYRGNARQDECPSWQHPEASLVSAAAHTSVPSTAEVIIASEV